MGLLDGGIASMAHSALAPFMLDMTLTRVTSGDYEVGTGRTNTETDYSCKGVVEADAKRYIDTGMIESGNRVATILQNSLTVTPKVGDTLLARSVSGIVQSVGQDPAQATWILGVTP